MSETTSVLPETDFAEPTLAERMEGAIWGQLVGDAFCLGSHWIYNLTEMEAAFPGGVHGFERPGAGHYHAGKEPGEQTHYGEGALVLLESVAARGAFDPADFLTRFEQKFASEEYKGYCDKATRGTLDNLRVWREEHPGAEGLDELAVRNGADDDQLATASRLAGVVVAHYGDQELLSVAERATRVCQNNERAVVYMQANALILRDLLGGRDVHSALHRAEEAVLRLDPQRGAEVRRKIAAGMNASLKSVLTAIVDEFGQSCPLASSFPSAVHSLLKHGDSFAEAMVNNARAGGDNAGRAGLLGAWLGALLGVRGIPEEWRNRLAARERITPLVSQIVGAAQPPTA